MNTKSALGIVIAALALFGVYYLYVTSHARDTASLTSGKVSTTTSDIIGAPQGLGTTTPAQPKTPGAKQPLSITAQKFALFDHANMIDTSGSPNISGIANVSKVDVVVIKDGVGVEAGRDIPVVNSHWSYTGAKILEPGKYLVQVLGGEQAMETTLTVK